MRFQIQLVGLELYGYHGVLQHEKDFGQQFFVDVDMVVDVANEDELSATVSYADVADLIEVSFNSERHDLLETLSARLRSAALSMSEKIVSCEVSVHKPNAPLNQKFQDVIVRALDDQ